MEILARIFDFLDLESLIAASSCSKLFRKNVDLKICSFESVLLVTQKSQLKLKSKSKPVQNFTNFWVRKFVGMKHDLVPKFMKCTYSPLFIHKFLQLTNSKEGLSTNQLMWKFLKNKEDRGSIEDFSILCPHTQDFKSGSSIVCKLEISETDLNQIRQLISSKLIPNVLEYRNCGRKFQHTGQYTFYLANKQHNPRSKIGCTIHWVERSPYERIKSILMIDEVTKFYL